MCNGQTGLRFLTASSPCSGGQLQNSDDMVIAVSDEESSIGGDEYAVWSIESAISWAANGTVAFVTVADDGFDNFGLCPVDSNGMAFGVGEPDITIWRDGNSFGSCELGVARGSAISGVATFSGAGEVMECAFFEVNFEECISFAEGEEECVVTIEIECSGAIQGSAIECRSIGCCSSTTSSCERGDGSGCSVYLSNSMITDVADIDVTCGVESDGVWLSQFCSSCGASIA